MRPAPCPSMCSRSMLQHQGFCFVYGGSQLLVCSVCSVCAGDILSDLSCHHQHQHTIFPIRWDQNKETTRTTSNCLQWAVGEGIGEHLTLTDASGEGGPGKIYCNLCATWLSSKGAVLNDHVLGKNKKNSDGKWERQGCTTAPTHQIDYCGTGTGDKNWAYQELNQCF